MRYLVDTNVLAELGAPNCSRNVIEWSQELEEISVSAVSYEEIQYGLTRSPVRPKLVDAMLHVLSDSRVTVLPVTRDVAITAGRLRAQLENEGKVRHQADMLIAATALHEELVIATRNVKDFRSIPIGVLNPFTYEQG